MCHFNPSILLKLFFSSLLSFGFNWARTSSCTLFLFLLLSHLHSPHERTVVWDINHKEPAHLRKLWTERHYMTLRTREQVGAHRVNTFSLLFKRQRVAQFSLHNILRCFVCFVLFCFVQSTFKIVTFCPKLFSFSKGRV